MKKTIDVTRRAIARALIELRKRRDWSQAELARRMIIDARYARSMVRPDQATISKWENGTHLPSPACRQLLAKIGSSHKRTNALALFFWYWGHLIHVHDLGLTDESQWPLRELRYSIVHIYTRGRRRRLAIRNEEDPGQ